MRVVKADTARLDDATKRAARDDMLMRMFVCFSRWWYVVVQQENDISISIFVNFKEIITCNLHNNKSLHRLPSSWGNLSYHGLDWNDVLCSLHLEVAEFLGRYLSVSEC